MALLRAGEFGASLDPPRTSGQIRRLCRQGRIGGAVRMAAPTGRGSRWMVPEHAEIEGRGRRIEYGRNTGVLPREYAEMNRVSTLRVYTLLWEGRFGDAARKTSHGWDIDPDFPWPADDPNF